MGQQDESSIGFQRRNDSQDHLHIQACRASRSHVGQEESSQGEELGAVLRQSGSWHAGRAQIERQVLAEDLKIARRDNKGGCSYVNQFFIMLMTSPKSGKGAEQEHHDSTLSISEHK